MQKFTKPYNLEKWSFVWSQTRLVIASVALFLGGIPPALYFVESPDTFNFISSVLKLVWIVSGLISAYMVYRWIKDGHKLFGNKNPLERYAFFVSVISGFNLGFAGLLGTNIGMSISHNYFVFVVVGLLYLATAFYLNKKWKAHGKKMF